jgi:hypothetical protein
MIGPKAGANWAVLGFVVIAITQWSVLSPCAVQIPREKGIDP